MSRRSAAWRSTLARVLTAQLRLDKPGPGAAARGAFDIGGQSMIVRTAYHFGDQPAETVVRETPPWQVWMGASGVRIACAGAVVNGTDARAASVIGTRGVGMVPLSCATYQDLLVRRCETKSIR